MGVKALTNFKINVLKMSLSSKLWSVFGTSGKKTQKNKQKVELKVSRRFYPKRQTIDTSTTCKSFTQCKCKKENKMKKSTKYWEVPVSIIIIMSLPVEDSISATERQHIPTSSRRFHIRNRETAHTHFF